MRLFFAFIALSAFIAVASSCKKNKDNPDYAAEANCSAIADSANRYTNSINALLDARCATSGCHNASAAGGINLSNYAGAKNAFQNRNALCSVHQGNDCQPMPNSGAKLSDSELNKLDCWVQNGFLE